MTNSSSILDPGLSVSPRNARPPLPAGPEIRGGSERRRAETKTKEYFIAWKEELASSKNISARRSAAPPISGTKKPTAEVGSQIDKNAPYDSPVSKNVFYRLKEGPMWAAILVVLILVLLTGLNIALARRTEEAATRACYLTQKNEEPARGIERRRPTDDKRIPKTTRFSNFGLIVILTGILFVMPSPSSLMKTNRMFQESRPRHPGEGPGLGIERRADRQRPQFVPRPQRSP